MVDPFISSITSNLRRALQTLFSTLEIHFLFFIPLKGVLNRVLAYFPFTGVRLEIQRQLQVGELLLH